VLTRILKGFKLEIQKMTAPLSDILSGFFDKTFASEHLSFKNLTELSFEFDDPQMLAKVLNANR